ncbi:MAG: AMP-binding protein [Prolixibacteraceae bacterium]|jgi:long-chain acyl-CoA synthetase|nr:AMP-binding protein [Prolixibacteraceae bacterium]MBT6006731.1 AMP-binding protein [Prolixibacteraceae bacterium]MBT6765285.1 AMP-binding protein [Prolixibacteraceae bacterium]MBT6996927.1 AMP-binding protein [Prolixibacteraceae bacterium]MBT7396945.1 AMP-binding protein [Prolixibacteraceae bacterium]
MTNSLKFTLPSMFSNSVEKFADKTSVVFTGEKNYTYKQMGDDVDLLAGMLTKLGVQQNEKVAILSTNMPNWGVAFFAISKLGAIVVPILPDFHEKEVKTIIEHSEAKLLFVSEELYKNINEEASGLVEEIILINNFSIIPKGTSVKQIKNLESSLPSEKIELPQVEIDEEDLASIIYTSGTTGNSKGVMLSHKNLAWTTQQARSLYQVKTVDRFLSVLPLSHTLENTVGFLLAIKNGASVHYLRKPPVASVLLPALELVKPTIMLTVPLIIEKVFKAKILPKFQKSPVMRFLYSLAPFRKLLHKVAAGKLYKTFGGELNFFGIGGAKLDPTVERFLYEGNFPYAIGYGLTETAPLLAGAVGKNRKIGSTGIAMEGVTLRVANADPVTGEGEIQAQGFNVMKGYYKAAETTKEVFTDDGWFRTGDRGMFDKNNLLHIKGRIKTMIVGASGENIYPEEIESVINKMKFVMESLVLEKKGKLVAMIHLNMEEIEENFKHLKSEAKQYIHEKSEETLKEIQKKVNEEVNKFSRIQQVILQPLPFERTPTKKIKRFLYA